MDGHGMEEGDWTEESTSASPYSTRQNTANNSRRESVVQDRSGERVPVVVGKEASLPERLVQVELERQTEEYLTRFEAAMRRHTEIREWYLLTGDGDYLLRLQITDMDHYARFHRDVLSRLPGVSRITSSFAMRSNRKP